MIEPAATTQPADQPLGTLCRVGFLLSGAFWIPLGLIFGIARALGLGTLTFGGEDVGVLLAIPAGLIGGCVAAILNDIALALGALVIVARRRIVRRISR